jgi:hypothetical protein
MTDALHERCLRAAEETLVTRNDIYGAADLIPDVAAAMEELVRDERDRLTSEVDLLKRMAEKCDAEGLAETPQKEWTPYQGKILAYDAVLSLLKGIGR